MNKSSAKQPTKPAKKAPAKDAAKIIPRKLPSGTPEQRVTKARIARAAKLNEDLDILEEESELSSVARARLEAMGIMPDPYTLEALRVLRNMGKLALEDDVQAAALYLKYTLPMPEQKHSIKADITTAHPLTIISHGIAPPKDNDSDASDDDNQ